MRQYHRHPHSRCSLLIIWRHNLWSGSQRSTLTQWANGSQRDTIPLRQGLQWVWKGKCEQNEEGLEWAQKYHSSLRLNKLDSGLRIMRIPPILAAEWQVAAEALSPNPSHSWQGASHWFQCARSSLSARCNGHRFPYRNHDLASAP